MDCQLFSSHRLQRAKFVSQAFQARCAQLALGRDSKPSSAPCDTRLFIRPTSVSANRTNVPTENDLRHRPKTAPSGSQPSLAGSNVSGDAEKRPDINEEAFMVAMHDMSKTLPVMSKRAEMEMQKLVRESTEMFLPNAMESHGIETRGHGPRKEKPTKQLPPPGYPRTQYMKPPALMIREKTFSKPKKSPRSMKSPRDVVKARPIHKANVLDSVEEYTDEEDDEIIAVPIHSEKVEKAEKPKEVVAQKATRVPARSNLKRTKAITNQNADRNADVANGGSAVKAKDLRTVGMKKQSEPKSGVRKNEALQRNESLNQTFPSAIERHAKHERHQQKQVRQQGSGKGRGREQQGGAEKTTKDAAYSILKKLTGKQEPGSHKPGQVPSVHRRPTKFIPPKETDNAAVKQAYMDESEQGLNKTVGIKPGDVRRVNSVKRPDKAQREQAERRTKDLSNVYEQGPKKPVSAPVRASLRQSFIERDWNKNTKVQQENPTRESQQKSQSADVHGREKQKSSGKPTAAGKTIIEKVDPAPVPTKAAIKIVMSEDGVKGTVKDETAKPGINSKSRDGKLVSSAGSHGNRKAETRSGYPRAAGSGKTKAEEMPDVKQDKSAGVTVSSSKGRGVKLQNAMISTSQEASKSKVIQESESHGDSTRASSSASSVHPKLQDSPYLRDNLLLQSGKFRKRPGGGSAHEATREEEA